MLKKTITYKDLDGNDVTEDFYFNLSKPELAELELRHRGGFSDHLKTIVDAQDGGKIVDTFKSIITMSIGRRSDDGRRFVKSEEIAEEFMQTDAYSVLFMELVTNADAAANFIQGMVPSDLGEAVAKGQRVSDIPLPEDDTPAYIRENREPTKAELVEMTPDELREAFRRRGGDK